MKRFLALLTAIMMLCTVLTACGDQNGDDSASNGTAAAAEKNVSLPDLLDSINTDMGISEKTVEGLNIITSKDDLYRKYGVAEKLLRQFGAERTSSKTDYMELVMIEATDEEAITQITNQLNSRLDAQLSTARSYNPEAVALLESCKVKTIGNFIYLVISKDREEIEAMIEEAIG